MKYHRGKLKRDIEKGLLVGKKLPMHTSTPVPEDWNEVVIKKFALREDNKIVLSFDDLEGKNIPYISDDKIISLCTHYGSYLLKYK